HMNFRLNNGLPNQIQMRASPLAVKSNMPYDSGIYAQDKWTVQRFTLNLGVRFDWLNIYFPEQHLGPAYFIPTRDVTFPKTDWVAWKDVTARVGAAYDLFGNGKTALKVSLNKYVLAGGVQGTLGDSSNPVNRMANAVTRTWTDANGNFIPDCDLADPLQQD